MPFDRDKFKRLVHYVCWKCEDPRELGAVKLNKILWFSDLLTYLNLGTPVTGARYVKRQFGPVPAAIIPVLEELKTEGALAIRDCEYCGHPKREFFALFRPDIQGLFSADEISIVDAVIDQIRHNHTATSISDLTHDDVWKAAEIGEELPMFTVFAARRGEVTEDDIIWADQQIEVYQSAA